MNYSLIICLIFLVVIILVTFFSESDAEIKRKVDEKLADHPKLSNSDYYTKFFSDSDAPEKLVTTIRTLLSQELNHDLSTLSADDDFSNDYSIILNLDSFGIVVFVLVLEEEFKIKISDEEAESLKSIRDVVEVVSRKIVMQNKASF